MQGGLSTCHKSQNPACMLTCIYLFLSKQACGNWCKHKISQLQKIKQLKRNMVCKYKFVLMNNEYNLYSILLQKNTLWFYLLLTWLEQEIFLTLVGRWIERSLQQISSFKLIRDLLFFKSSNMKALRLKFFEALEAWSVELQKFGFVEDYGGFLA